MYGVFLAIIGAVGENVGNHLVSFGHKQHHKKGEVKCVLSVADASAMTEHTDHSSPNSSEIASSEPLLSWCNLGRIIFVLAALFTFGAFAFGAQSLVASLGSIQFVSNVFCVWYIQGEPVTVRMMIATAAIVAGNVLVVIFGSQAAVEYTSVDMIELYKENYPYHAYMGIALVLWVITSYVYMVYHDSRMKKRVLLWHHSFLEPFCYAMSSAIVGTQAVLNAKCMALLLDVTLQGVKNEFETWYLYFILATWLLLVSYWLKRLDDGLAMFPPAFIIPVMQVFFVFFAIVCGGIYFEEFVDFTPGQFAGFFIGVALILGGVVGLAPVGMQLHVPGDPAAPADAKIALCDATSATVHPEFGQSISDLESLELDRKIDDKLSLKPLPVPGLEEIPLFPVAAVPVLGPADEKNLTGRTDIPSFDAEVGSTRSTPKPGRKVVKRPSCELRETVALPPVVGPGTGTRPSSVSQRAETRDREQSNPETGIEMA